MMPLAEEDASCLVDCLDLESMRERAAVGWRKGKASRGRGSAAVALPSGSICRCSPSNLSYDIGGAHGIFIGVFSTSFASRSASELRPFVP